MNRLFNILIKKKSHNKPVINPFSSSPSNSDSAPTDDESTLDLNGQPVPSVFKTNNKIITDINEIEFIIPTTNNQVIDILTRLNRESPAIVTDQLDVYSIADNELNQNESVILNKIVSTVKRLKNSDDITHYQVTRTVFDSYNDSITQTDLQEEIKERSNYVEAILTRAIKNKATDIHIEIKRNNCYIFERVYGELKEVEHFSSKQGEKIIYALWNIYVKQNYSGSDAAKDGRHEYNHNGKDWLCRVSYIYSKVNRERSTAIRLRDMHHIPKLEELGYTKRQLALIERATMTKGMILMIGSVNSGKSTTQTAIMNKRPRNYKNFELSDQIEVNVKNFVQIQLPVEGTKESIAEDKELMRRVSTRHDVNFIAINEIRDIQTAAMASSMLLQGTTAISSIHGSSWADAINRMLSPADLNIAENILFSESFLSLTITQTLIGILCKQCKLKTCSTEKYHKYFLNIFGDEAMNNVYFHNKDGCVHCKAIGFTGLTLAAEVIPVRETNRALFKDTTNAQAMREWQRKNKHFTIHEHAYLKISQGQIDPLKVEEKIGPFSKYNLFDKYLSEDELF